MIKAANSEVNQATQPYRETSMWNDGQGYLPAASAAFSIRFASFS
jgi:hypothetical protein